MLTKKDLSRIEELLERKLDEKLDQKLDQKLDEKLDEKLKKYATREEVLTFHQEVMGEIRSLRDELAIVVGYRDMIENHDQRLDRVETVLRLPTLVSI